jgi:GT2 family glycosyltransferase
MVTASIVILTFNRNDHLERLLRELMQLETAGLEIIVVDNASTVPAAAVAQAFPSVRVIRSPKNLGASGRNLGLEAARGEVVITLDDDVRGLTDAAIAHLVAAFEDRTLGAVNFKVIEDGTGSLTNWVHHREAEQFADTGFDTYEITEGAVALRRSALRRSGLYPDRFFISHEGPDLAYRLLDAGYRVTYEPRVAVIHAYAPAGRASWRNYYFDTRNTLWLAVRNLPLLYGAKLYLRQSAAMLLYSVRDGFLWWWVRGIWDGLRGVPQSLRERRCISLGTLRRLREMDRHRPGVMYLLRKRLLQRGVKI